MSHFCRVEFDSIVRPKCDCLFIRRTCAAELIRQCVSVNSKCNKGTVSTMADEGTTRMRGLFNFYTKFSRYQKEKACDAAVYVSMVNTTTGTFDCASFVSRK